MKMNFEISANILYYKIVIYQKIKLSKSNVSFLKIAHIQCEANEKLAVSVAF